MLRRPNSATLRDLGNLRRTQTWQSVEKYLEDELSQTMDRILATRETSEIWTLQGRAQVIKEFLAVVRDAETATARGAG